MLRATLTLALTLSLALAGCMGNDEPVESAAVATAAAGAAAGDAANLTADAANATLPEPVAIDIHYSGSTVAGACVFPAGVCRENGDGVEDYHRFEATGTPTRLSLSIAYADQAPGMAFYASLCTGDGTEESAVTCNDYQTAPSPIVLDVDLTTFPAGTVFGLSVGSISEPSAATGATMVFGPSSFDVTGTMTVLSS